MESTWTWTKALSLVQLTLAASQSGVMLDAPVMKRRDLKQQKMATDRQEKMDARVCCAAAKQDNRVILVWAHKQGAMGPRVVLANSCNGCEECMTKNTSK